jgi:N-acetylneuraminic acid mutarotase
MIVWGGFSGAPSFVALNDGARYDPQTDSWQRITAGGQPSIRLSHTAVWTGSEMIVWGGFSCEACSNSELDTGARYDPSTDTWTAVTTANAPAARGYHSAVWTGSAMIVWGGANDGPPGPILFASGGVYDPATDSWTATSLIGAPLPTRSHSAVWTGAEMIEFGGQTDAGLAPDTTTNGYGSRYDPGADVWTPMTTAPVSSSISGVRAVWTGTQLFTWFESVGARYAPSSDTWSGISSFGAPSSRRRHSLVWTGSQMIVWGGDWAVPVDSGGMYNPAADPPP